MPTAPGAITTHCVRLQALDQRVYLHTTLVVLQALLATHEGAWPTADE
jgi:hypothetical protein